MANVFTSTATITNLTRLELEQLRRADAFTAGKALTVGDAAYGSEGVVGKGDLNAEPYYTGPELPLDDIITNTPPTNPGKGLSTQTVVAGMPSDSVSWVGPELIYDSNVGWAETTTRLRDDTPGLNFTLFVQAGDLLLIKTRATGVLTRNSWAVGTVSVVAANTLTLTNINNPSLAPYNALEAESSTATYNYVIVRPSAAQLFAVPGSGPTGQEQTFMMVNPGASVHGLLSPTVDQVNAVRLKNVVPPHFSSATAVDRADAVYGSPAPRASLDMLGYRIVLYPDNGSGTGPDLTRPIATLNPVINSTIAASDQRMTIDYQAGIVRLSCAPRTGDDIKPAAGCVNATTGRLNLYAVYWVVDTSLTKGNARGLYASRNDYHSTQAPGKVEFDQTNNWWKFHSGVEGNYFYVRSLDTAETGETFNVTEFGAYDYVNGPRGFKYRQSRDAWYFTRHTPIGSDPATSVELIVADKTALTIGDGANPAISPGGDSVPGTTIGDSLGYRHTRYFVDALLKEAAFRGYGTVHLRNGRYIFDRALHMPPGVLLEGEGPGTVISTVTSPTSTLRFGPNTTWGVYDFSWSEESVAAYPTTVSISNPNLKIEGYDIVWNPNKRCWGYAWADTSSHEIWFQEINLQGEHLHSGYGIPLKSSVRHLFTNESTNSERHTAGHYPRLAYSPIFNKYGIVWVDEISTGCPVVQAQMFRVTDTDTISVLNSQTLGDATEHKDHPSVTFTKNSLSDAYLHIAMSGYNATTRTMEYVRITPGGSVFTQVNTLNPTQVITSTDITIHNTGEPFIAASIQDHPLIEIADGYTIPVGPSSRFYHNVPGFSFIDAGVEIGSKVHHLNTTAGATDGGKDGYVTAVGVAYVEVKHEDSPDMYWDTIPAPGVGFRWAISPASAIYTFFTYGGSLSRSRVTANDPPTTTTTFRAEMREADFVRISENANNQVLIVYQAFNTTAFLARTTMTNFDNAVSGSFIDGYDVPVKSQFVYREHIGTCAVLVGHTETGTSLIMPKGLSGEALTLNNGFAPNTMGLMHLTEIPAKNLGAAAPLISRPNSPWLNVKDVGSYLIPWGVKRGYHLEISARNVVHKWTASKPVSLIPAVTWTGEDWTVVSPTQRRIYSDTGYVVEVSGVYYLIDETFYFGGGAVNAVDGNYLVETASGAVYLSSLGTSVTYTIISEHCVRLDATPPLGRTSWYAYKGDSSSGSASNLNTSLKNMLFRVAADGTLIQGCSRLTEAMSHIWDADYMPLGTRVETVSRRKVYTQYTPNVSTGGANDPMTVGELAPDSLGTAGWCNDYPTSRISGDIGFVGAAAGGPKGYSWRVPNEAPMVALAWGETCFALVDRMSSTTNQLTVYRQSAGPYRSGVQNLRIENVNTNGYDNIWMMFNPIRVESRSHVYTRWGYPATGSGTFATDGYRMCFVHPTQRKLQNGSQSNVSGFIENFVGSNWAHGITWNATYTNAIGEGPIEYEGPESLIGPNIGYTSVGVPTTFPTGEATYADTGTDPYPDVELGFTGASSPLVIWNGKNFVAFWTELSKHAITALTNGVVRMGIYPGDAATHNLDTAVTAPWDGRRNIASEYVQISSGEGHSSSGSGLYVDNGFMYACDAAFSGKTYCVVWVTGVNPGASLPSAYRSGSMVGVTIFHGLDGSGGASNYALEAEAVGNYFVSPKVIWDGTNFVIFYRDNSGGVLLTKTIPEIGLGQPIQALQLTSPATVQDEDLNVIGVVQGDGTIDTSYHTLCAAGDTLHITMTRAKTTITSGSGASTSGGALIDTSGVDFTLIVTIGDVVKITAAPITDGVLGTYVVTGVAPTSLNLGRTVITTTGVSYKIYRYTNSTAYAGWYTVQAFEPPYTIHLASGTTLANITGHEVIGALLTTSIRGNYAISLYTSSSTTGIIGNAIDLYARPISYIDNVFEPGGAPTVSRLLDVLYNEEVDAYVILYLDSNGKAYILKSPRNNVTNSAQRIPVDSSGGIRTGALAWNGREYLVTLARGTNQIYYYVISSTLGRIAWGLLTHPGSSAPLDPIGNQPGQAPGSLYGPYVPIGDQTWIDTASPLGAMQARLMKQSIRWNDRLGRWVVSASYLWGLNNGAALSEYGMNGLSWYDGISLFSDNPVTGYSGRTLTGHFYVPMIQPGMRLAFWDYTNNRIGVVMTIMAVGTRTADPSASPAADIYTSLTVDVDSSELTASDIAIVTAARPMFGPLSTFVIGREDVFVWTLAPGKPAISLVDADSCYLNNVDIDGGGVDISEFYSMAARPTWQSAGAMTGASTNVNWVMGASLVRNYTRSFLSPVGKVETLRLTNVRSRAVKYGRGSDPADPVKGGQRASFRNRRS